MFQSRVRSLVVGFAMVFSSNGFAAEAIALQHASFANIKQHFALTWDRSLKSSSALKDSLQLVSEHTDDNQVTHVRMQQRYLGFPVFGGFGILHSKKSPKALHAGGSDEGLMNGIVYQGLEAELGAPKPSFVEKAPAVLQQFTARYAGESLREASVTPMVYIHADHHAVWAYQVSVLVLFSDKIPERPTAIIDASTLKPLVQWDNLKTAYQTVKGAGYGGNARTHKYQYGKTFPYLSLQRDESLARCYLRNKTVTVMDMHSQFDEQKGEVMSFDCQKDSPANSGVYWTGSGDGYDRINGGFSPSNDALFAGNVIHDMYKKWYGEEVLTKNQEPLPLVMRVHYGHSYENAFWDGQQMTFGDGNTLLYPLVSIGVGAHEISHGFTEQHANLVYFGQAGGMNESFSDMAAQAAEFYATGTNSFQIGPEILKEQSGFDALRYMDKPSRDGYSIDTADQYIEGLDVHYSSGVFNRLFYVLATEPGWDVRQAFHVMLKANMDYWTPYSTFEEGGCGILQAAADLNYPLDAVSRSLAAVSLTTEACQSLSPSHKGS